jgi:hypothetical protein
MYSRRTTLVKGRRQREPNEGCRNYPGSVRTDAHEMYAARGFTKRVDQAPIPS